ncbi:MAG: hypothetical protein ACFFFG_11355 [Candidatus Thorarchaeota archaeon]
MKSFNRDAKQLIRSYIDSVEEYLTSKTRLHPNEVDSLLSEINDFLYLRSSEIATDPDDRVFFTDAIKAIEECGSPSEIGDFLSSDDREPSQIESEFLKSRQSSERTYEKAKEFESATMKESADNIKSEDRTQIEGDFFEGFVGSYSRFKVFGVYRVFTLFLAFFLVVGLLSYYYYQLGHVSPFAINYLVFFAPISLIWEAVVINGWKDRLVMKGFERKNDDFVVLWLFRLTLLAALLKVSYFFHIIYIWLIPITIMLFAFIERQLRSDLWKTKLSPFFGYLANKISQEDSGDERVQDWQSWAANILPKTLLGRIVIGILSLILLLDFMGLGIVNYNINSFFGINGGRTIASGFGILIGVFSLGTHRFRNVITGQIEAITIVEKNFVIWLMRLILMRQLVTRIMDPGISYLLLFVMAGEILAETYGGTLFRLFLISLFTRLAFGRPETTSVPLLESRILTEAPSANDNQNQGFSRNQIQSTSAVRSPVKDIQDQSSSLPSQPNEADFVEKRRSRSRNSLSLFVSAIITTLFILLASFYEVILATIIILTNFNPDGAYTINELEFGIPLSSPPRTIVIDGITIWIWYGLFLLGLQLFLQTLLDSYGAVRGQQEGFIVKASRNFSRFWLLLVFAGVGYRALFFFNSYTLIQGLVACVLFIFSEITAWRSRVERRKLFFDPPVSQSTGEPPHNKSLLNQPGRMN